MGLLLKPHAGRTLLPAPIVKRQGNMAALNLSVVVGVWADVEADGTAAARPMDVVIPNVVAGQWIEVSSSLWVAATTGVTYLDLWTIVDGVPVNKFGGNYGEGVERATGWILTANAEKVDLGNARPYQVQAADIQDGSVRVRMRSNCAIAGAGKAIQRASGSEFTLVGRGPLG